MNNDKLIGVGIGLLIGWWLWRRRYGLAFGAGAVAGSGSGSGSSGVGGGLGGACCGSCAPRCSPLVSGGLGIGNYAQATGPALQGSQT